MPIPDLTGQRFERLVVLSREPNDKHYCAMWLCQCDCGEEKVIRGKELRKGTIRSCGCLRREQAVINVKNRKSRSKKDWNQRTEKYCPNCEQTFPIDKFGNNRSSYDGFTGYCKSCHATKGRESRIRNWGSSRHHHLVRKYGITAVEADALLEKQDGVCAICQKIPDAISGASWHIDHDHSTGEVRGVLCHHCNTALGNFFDDLTIIGRAMNYLESGGSEGMNAKRMESDHYHDYC